MERKKKKKQPKVPVFIPELNLTVYVDPDSKISEVRGRYIGQREFKKQRIKVAFE